MTAASDARDRLAALIGRAMDAAAKCSYPGPGDCPSCDAMHDVAMTAATVYAEQYAAQAIEKALAPYRAAAAAREHSPRMGRGKP